jgi:hypothetical protein
MSSLPYLRRFDDPLRVRFAGDVGLQGNSVPASGLDYSDRLLRRLDATIDGYNLGPFLREQDRSRFAVAHPRSR